MIDQKKRDWAFSVARIKKKKSLTLQCGCPCFPSLGLVFNLCGKKDHMKEFDSLRWMRRRRGESRAEYFVRVHQLDLPLEYESSSD